MSNSLREALSLERTRLFIGRQAEVGYVSNWLRQPHAPTEVLLVSGMGGIGKSALVLQLLNIAQEENSLCIWLDGRACTGSPAGFLDTIHSYLFQWPFSVGSVQSPLQEIRECVARQRTLLCIDNFDHLNQIEGWLREVFLPELPATELMVVLAARQHLMLEWESDLAWRGRITHMRLGPISRVEARQYYENLGFTGPEIDRLIHNNGCHPLAMALDADSLSQMRKTGSQHKWPVSRLVSASLFREVATPDLYQLLEILCVLPQANTESLNRFLQIPVTVDQFNRLTQLSFVRPATNGIALHDVARAYLLEDFRHRDLNRYETLRRRIVDEACRSLKTAEPPAKEYIAASLLSICRDALPLNPNFGFSDNADATSFDLFHKTDLPHLHRLVNEEQFEKATTLESNERAHELLNALAEQFPESIRVLRSAAGIPMVFRAGLMLYRESCDFLQCHLPHVLEACFQADAVRMIQLRRDEADTHFHFLGAADHHHPDYTFHELYGYMFTDGFSRTLGAGIRVTITTQHESLKESLQALGCKTRVLRYLPPTHPAHNDLVLEFDFRAGDFGDWVRSFLEGRSADSQVAKLTREDVKEALAVYADTSALAQTAVADRLNCDGRELQDILQHILRADPPPFPLKKNHQSLLRLLSSVPFLSAEEAAQRLHISRATYYRYQHDALDNVLNALSKWQQLSGV